MYNQNVSSPTESNNFVTILPATLVALAGITLTALIAYLLIKNSLAALLAFRFFSGTGSDRRVLLSVQFTIRLIGGAAITFVVSLVAASVAWLSTFRLDDILADERSAPSAVILPVLIAPLLYILVFIGMTTRLRYLTKRRTPSEWTEWFPPHLQLHMYRRIVLAALKVELAGTIIIVTLLTRTGFVYAFSRSPDLATLRQILLNAQSQLPGMVLGVILAAFIILAVLSHPELLAVYSAFDKSDYIDDEEGDHPELDVDLRSTRWRTKRHRVAFSVAKSLQRSASGFRERLTVEQHAAVSSTCDRLSHALRRLGVTEKTSPSSTHDLLRHFRATVSILVRDDVVAACEHASILLKLDNESTSNPLSRFQRIVNGLSGIVQKYWPAGKVAVFFVAAIVLILTGQIEKIAEFVFK